MKKRITYSVKVRGSDVADGFLSNVVFFVHGFNFISLLKECLHVPVKLLTITWIIDLLQFDHGDSFCWRSNI